MPAAAPAVSCSRCYAHSATGRATGRGAAAHCQRSGARQSSQASRSTRSPTCGAAGSCSRSARALLRDKKKAGSAVPALLRLAALLPATRALAACSTWQRRTFAHTQGLEGRFVAHGHLARLHDESQARVDALNSRLLLLQSTGEHRHAEATAVAGGTGQPTSGASRWTGWLAVLVVPEHWWVPPTTAKERTLPLAVSPMVLRSGWADGSPKDRGEEETAGRHCVETHQPHLSPWIEFNASS